MSCKVKKQNIRVFAAASSACDYANGTTIKFKL